MTLFILVCFTNTQKAEAQTEWDQFLYENEAKFCDAYPYFTLGVGPVVILPNVGVGYRSHFLHHGFDVSLSYSPIIEAHQAQAIVAYQFYPNPYRNDPWYVGLGAATSYFFDNRHNGALTVAPDISVGKVLATKSGERHFLEAHIQAPTFSGADQFNLPMMYVKYGVSF